MGQIYDISVAVIVKEKEFPTQAFVYEEVREALKKGNMKVLDLKVEERR